MSNESDHVRIIRDAVFVKRPAAAFGDAGFDRRGDVGGERLLGAAAGASAGADALLRAAVVDGVRRTVYGLHCLFLHWESDILDRVVTLARKHPVTFFICMILAPSSLYSERTSPF